MTVGQELSKARRNLGLSLDDLSSKTSCSIDLLRSIEETDLRRLPSRSTLETATRAYAAAVHLDAGDVTGRYLAQLPILPNTTEALTAFEPEADAHGRQAGSGLLVYESAYDGHPGRPPIARATVARPELMLRIEPDPGIPSGEPAPPVHRSGPNHSATTRDYRFPIAALLIASAIAVGVGYLVGAQGDRVSDLSGAVDPRVAATGGSQARQPDAAVEHAVAPGTEAALPVRAGTPTLAATNEAPDDAATTGGSRGAAARGKEPVAGKRAEPGTASANRGARSADAVVPSAVIIVPGTLPASGSPAKTRPATRDEISGSWDVIAHDESSDAAPNRVRYYLQLSQRGPRVAGSGYRVSDDGPDLTSSQRAVEVTGILSGERLTLNFTGHSREHFVLYRAVDGVFRGRFRRDFTPSGGSSIVTLAPRELARRDPD